MEFTKSIYFKIDIKTTDDKSQSKLLEDFADNHTASFNAKPLADAMYKKLKEEITEKLAGYEQPNKLKFKSKLELFLLYLNGRMQRNPGK